MPPTKQYWLRYLLKNVVNVVIYINVCSQNPTDEAIQTSLRALINNTARLQTDCSGLQNSSGTERTIYLQQVRSTAYDIAKATKQLVSTQLQAPQSTLSRQPSLSQQQSV